MLVAPWLALATSSMLAAASVSSAAPFSTTNSEKVSYHITLAAADQAGLDARMNQALGAGGQWLSPEELRQFVQAKPGHLDAVRTFLVHHGIAPEDIQLSHLGDRLSVTSTRRQAQAMFARSQTLGTKRADDPAALALESLVVPSHLQDAIAHISYPFLSTHSTAGPGSQKKNASSASPLTEAQIKAATSGSASCSQSLVTPACLRNFYGASNANAQPKDGNLDIVTLLIAGAGADEADLRKYLQKYRTDLSDANTYRLSTNVSSGGAEAPGSLGHGSEGYLDVETIAGIAAPLNVGMVKYGSPETEDVSKLFSPALRYILDNYHGDQLPGVISVSYGSDETDVSPSDAQELCSTVQKLTAQGTTVVFAAGDAGVTGAHGTKDGCQTKWTPPYPSGCPYVLSVGGTQDFNPARAVDGSKTYYSGAGFSNLFQRPSWQDGPVQKYLSTLGTTGKGKFNSSGRAFPDIAAAGMNLPTIVVGYNGTDSGTSAAAPVAASIIALANNQRQNEGKQRLGFLHPKLYGNAGLTTDVTQGSTGAQKCSDVLPATSGWDLASGLGYLNYQSLVNA